MKLFCLCCALAAAVITPTAAVANDKLTVATWGGAYSDSQNKAFFEPFMKAGNDLTIETYNGEIGRIRAQVKSKAVTWDVIDIDTQTALSACAEGLLEKIDWKKLGLDRETFIGAKQQVCAVPNIVYATVLAYDTTKLKTGPSKTADLFDLKAFPGKRGLRKSPVVNLEWALLADGVKQADLYALLRTKAGVDRAFRKLDTIKSEIIWWEAGAQPQQMLSTGQVVMTSAWNGYVALAVKKDKKPYAMIWDNQGLDWNWWALVKGGAHIDAGYKFVAYASDPNRMANQTREIPYGPANRDAIPLVDKDILLNLPTSADNLKSALLVDVKFWADRGDALKERFETWLAR